MSLENVMNIKKISSKNREPHINTFLCHPVAEVREIKRMP